MPMKNFTVWIQKKLGKQKSNISVGQLSQALELASEEDTTNEEKKILEGIVSFGNTETREVMVPRVDIFALSEELSYQELLNEIVAIGYSRIPVLPREFRPYHRGNLHQRPLATFRQN